MAANLDRRNRPFGLLAAKFEQERAAEQAKYERKAQYYGQRVRERNLQWAGDQADAMLHSAEAASDRLAHTDPYMRLAALYFVCTHWGRAANYRADILRLAQHDSDLNVRDCAISNLGQAWKESKDPEIAQFLAKCVADESEALEIRQTAYFALRQVMHLYPFRWGLPTSIEIPEQIDWRLIDACLRRETFEITEIEDLPIEQRIAQMLGPRILEAFRHGDEADAAFAAGNYAVAVRLYSNALAHRPNAPGILYRRGCAAGNLGDLDAAIADFTAVIDCIDCTEVLTKYKPIAYCERAEAYTRQHRTDLAAADLRMAAELEESSLES
jgi:tetratricopeptide (TPR) repeat protein